MSASPSLDPVLNHIDGDLDDATQRLMELLQIPPSRPIRPTRRIAKPPPTGWWRI